MTEVVEYRLAKVHAAIYNFGGLVLIGIGALSGGLSVTHQSFALSLSAFLFVLFGIFCQLYALALTTNGRARTFFRALSFVGSVEEDDPPLKDWYDDLEERAAFAVSEVDFK